MTGGNPEPNDERQERTEIARNRIRQIFRFLKDFNGLRNPIKRQISEQPWVLWIHDLPTHPCLWLRGRDSGDDKVAPKTRIRVNCSFASVGRTCLGRRRYPAY